MKNIIEFQNVTEETFSHLPKTNLEAYGKKKKWSDRVESVKVDSLDSADGHQIIVSQQQGQDYLQRKDDQFRDVEHFRAWRNNEIAAKIEFCNKYGSA